MVRAFTAHVEHQVGIDDVAAAKPVVEVDSSLQQMAAGTGRRALDEPAYMTGSRHDGGGAWQHDATVKGRGAG